MDLNVSIFNNNGTLNCPYCHSKLQWEDTIDHFGGIDDGYFSELRVYSCDFCKQDYIAQLTADFDKKSVKLVDFQET